MTIRAGTLVLKELSSVLDRAVGAAADKHGLKPSGHNTLFLNWELVGRRLLEAEAKTAQAFSEHVATDLNAAGIKAEPVTILLPKGGVLAGWFPVDRLNELQF